MILAGIKASRVGAGESLQSPSMRMTELLGGSETYSGQDVTESRAETLSAFYCGVRIISEMGAAGPVNTYEQNEGSPKRVAKEHVSYQLLRYPNEYQTGMALREAIWWCAIVWGDGLAEIERDGRGRPMALHHIHKSRAWLDSEALRRGRLVWNVNNDRGGVQIDDEDMFHLKGPGDGIVGKPVVTILRETIGRALAVREHGASWFKGGGRLQALLKHPAVLEKTKAKQLVEGFQETWAGGKDGSQKIGLLYGGLDFAQNLATTNEDAQFLETDMYGIEEICRALNIQPHILKHLLRATNNNIEHQGLEFYTMTMLPWFRRFETEAEFKLVRLRDRDRYFIRHNADFILRGDYKSRMEGNAIAVQWGIDTIDEIRDRDDKNPHPDGQGAVPLIPATHKPAQAFVQEAKRASAPGADDIAFKREVVKGLIADGTIGDVIFNLTDGRELLRQVNVPIPAGSPEEPWLPVVAANGPLVSGETIEDSQGDIVGGDVEPATEEPPPEPPPPDDGNGSTPKPKEPDDNQVKATAELARRADVEPATEEPPPEPPPPDDGNGSTPKPKEPDDNQVKATAELARRADATIQSLFVHAAGPIVRLTASKIQAIEKRDGDLTAFLNEHETFVISAVAPVLDAAYVMRGVAVNAKAADRVFIGYRSWIESFDGKRGRLIEQQGAGKLVSILAEVIK